MDQCSPCQKPLANMIAVHMVSFIHLYIQSCVCVFFFLIGQSWEVESFGIGMAVGLSLVNPLPRIQNFGHDEVSKASRPESSELFIKYHQLLWP